jgi:hypothetical protein
VYVFVHGDISVMCLVSCNVRDGVAVAYNDYGFVCNDSGNVVACMKMAQMAKIGQRARRA